MALTQAQEAANLRRAKDLVDRSYASPLDVAALASSANVSTAHFARRFKEAFGETPYQYVITRRTERAQELLRNTDLSVTEICFEVGFQSLGSFSTKFKALVGGTPTEYRRKALGLSPIPTCVVMAWTRPRGRAVLKKT
jgi:AraC-like DNA-binding protein